MSKQVLASPNGLTAKRMRDDLRRAVKASLALVADDLAKIPIVVEDGIKKDVAQKLHLGSPAELIRKHPKTAATAALVCGITVGIMLPVTSASAVGATKVFQQSRRNTLFRKAISQMTALVEHPRVSTRALHQGQRIALALASSILNELGTHYLHLSRVARAENDSHQHSGAQSVEA